VQLPASDDARPYEPGGRGLESCRARQESSVTQAAAGEVLHVTRPRVSDVINHKLEKFTIDALVSMLSRIGKRVNLAVQ
jgi:predicted XRE-type DNA-binding protein